jgi:hypothetical protein
MSVAAAIVERLRPRVPDAIGLYVDAPGVVAVSVDEERTVRVRVDEPDDTDLDEEIPYDPPYPAFGVLEVLDAVQELAREELELDWPQGAPAPGAALGGGEIRLWFGDESSPALAFEPIPLD